MLANVRFVTDGGIGGTGEYVLMWMAIPCRDHPDYQQGRAIEL